MSNITVSSGQISSGTVFAEQSLTVLSGGLAVDVIISSGGLAEISSGGSAISTTLTQDSFQYVSSGGSAIDTVALSGGTEIVLAGGSAFETLVSVGGNQTISSGGIASSAILTMSGAQAVYAGGSAISTNIQSGGAQTVFAGGSASGTLVSAGGDEYVSSGGFASDTMLTLSGTEYVYAGGSALGDFVLNGGAEIIMSGGYASDTVVSVGGEEAVSSGGLVSSAVITLSGVQDVYASGRAISTNIQSGAEIVHSGGLTSLTLVSAGGVEVASSGGVVSSSILTLSGDLNVLSGGSAVSAVVLSGGYENVSSGGTATGTLVSVGGFENISSGGVTSNDLITLSGAQDILAGGSATSTYILTGGLEIVSSGGTADATTVGSGGEMILSSGGLAIDPLVIASGSLVFTLGGIVDVTSLTYVSGGEANLNSGTDLLTVTEGAQTYSLQLASGEASGEYFHLGADKNGGTDITLTVTPCYCPGTLILTPEGEVPVEDLKIGDRVTTLSGADRPIKWIGRRAYGGRFALGRADILPIRIAAGALDAGVPRRDLLVSPHHALYLDGVLIEACDLVNGASITQAERVESVTYIHIELDTHDVILAEGAPAESFIDDDTRMMFHNAHEYRALHPDEPVQPARYCAPRLNDGYAVEAARRRIERRAGIKPGSVTKLAFRGYIDVIDAERIVGWAQNPDHPEAPVCLDIYVEGVLVGQTLANRRRADLAWAGVGNGGYGFVFAFPEGVYASPGNTQVRRSLDGAMLPFSVDCQERARVRG
jgi:autotransporter passenger strand-loop-strand repeat protein